VIGIGQAESKGLRKGVVINLEATVESIKRVVEEAELMAGVEIGSAYVGLAGTHIRGFNSRGVIAVSGRNRVIEREDVHRAIEAAKAVSIPMDREILHVLPQEFVVDDQDGIGDPTGMTGTRLEVNVHIITCSQTAAQNTVTCVNRAGLEVIDTVLTQLAADGKQVDEVSCPDLSATVGASQRCTLKAGGDTYGVTVTVTSVQGTDVKFDIQVDSTPITSPSR